MKIIIRAASLVAVLTLNTEAVTLTVNADANIFGAGHNTPPGPGGGGCGTLPPSFSFIPASGLVLTFSSVTGGMSLTAALGVLNGPDGYTSTSLNSTAISSFGGISGIRCRASGFLVGVFLDQAEPAGTAPSIMDFGPSALGTDFVTLTPEIGQVFFVGDGLTGTASGNIQQFNVPPTATRLYLGFADAHGYTGPPGQYHDNVGALEATFEIAQAGKSFQITAIEQVFHNAFTRTCRIGWNSDFAASYRISISDDLENWTPARAEAWPSEGLHTEAEITLPVDMPAAYFRVEEE